MTEVVDEERTAYGLAIWQPRPGETYAVVTQEGGTGVATARIVETGGKLGYTGVQRLTIADNLDRRLAVIGPADEVKDLADTIDELLERLEASSAAQRRSVANASHELRTPLATIRASLDVAVAKPDPAASTVALADRLRTQLDRVDLSVKEFAMLEALLLASPGFLSTEALLEQVWDENADPFTNTVTVTMGRLRRKLGSPPTIATTPGIGYRVA
ncbi:MAG: winged helix-turn-helix domain-containing protein [Actinomadura sp.]